MRGAPSPVAYANLDPFDDARPEHGCRALDHVWRLPTQLTRPPGDRRVDDQGAVLDGARPAGDGSGRADNVLPARMQRGQGIGGRRSEPAQHGVKRIAQTTGCRAVGVRIGQRRPRHPCMVTDPTDRRWPNGQAPEIAHLCRQARSSARSNFAALHTEPQFGNRTGGDLCRGGQQRLSGGK